MIYHKTPLDTLDPNYSAITQTPPHTLSCIQGGIAPTLVQFQIAIIDHTLSILFTVREDETRITYVNDNEPVYEDSCVELFLQDLADPSIYHNFESTAAGTLLSQTGPNRFQRLYKASSLLKTIVRSGTLIPPEGNLMSVSNEPMSEWELLLQIPGVLFGLPPDRSLKEYPLHGNVYKCGDKLTHPHWISFFPIECSKPDFHRPEFFQSLNPETHF
ncbi:MAG: carbohydrate-binding family 9-like protein [Fibrobacterales bacterium]